MSNEISSIIKSQRYESFNNNIAVTTSVLITNIIMINACYKETVGDRIYSIPIFVFETNMAFVTLLIGICVMSSV